MHVGCCLLIAEHRREKQTGALEVTLLIGAAKVFERVGLCYRHIGLGCGVCREAEV